MEATSEITALIEDIADTLEDADQGAMDAEERVEVYGKVERARGVLLAYQAAHEQAAVDTGADLDDAPDGWTTRLRAAWRSLRGQDLSRSDAGGPPPALAADADEVGDSLAEYADGLRDHLADLDEDEGDLRMFQ